MTNGSGGHVGLQDVYSLEHPSFGRYDPTNDLALRGFAILSRQNRHQCSASETLLGQQNHAEIAALNGTPGSLNLSILALELHILFYAPHIRLTDL